MKAIMLRDGTILNYGPYDIDKEGNVLTYWCYPKGQNTLDVESESYTPVKANQVLWIDDPIDLSIVAEFVQNADTSNKEILIKNCDLICLLDIDYQKYGDMLIDCFKIFKHSLISFISNEWDGKNEYAIIVEHTSHTVETKSYYNVFKDNNNQYVGIREVNLAYGNIAKEIYFTSDISCAYKFHTGVENLQALDYHHQFPRVLEQLLANLECVRLSVTSTYKTM